MLLETQTTNTVRIFLSPTSIVLSTTAMTMRTRKNARDVDVRGGNAKRIKITRERSTMTRDKNCRALTIRKEVTEVMVKETTMVPQVYTKASTDLGMTQMRCLFQIIL